MDNINRSRLSKDGYLIGRDVIPVELIDEVIDFSNKNLDKYVTDIDPLFGAEYKNFDDAYSYSIQAQFGINNPYAKIHSFLLDYIQETINMRLLPTYHYGRIHLDDKSGMQWHTDRASCEVSVTMPIAYSGPPWPVWLQANNGKQKVDLKVGDILIYKGMEIPHHREPYNNDYAFQHYFHFVDVESEVGSLMQYFDPLKQEYWKDNITGVIERDDLPIITEEDKKYYKEKIL